MEQKPKTNSNISLDESYNHALACCEDCTSDVVCQIFSDESYVYLSDDGIKWDDPYKVGEFNWWMWRVIWSPEGDAYGIGYDCLPKNGENTTRLSRSSDGLDFTNFLPRFTPQDRTNEAAMIFRSDGSAVTLVRRDGKAPTGAIVGTSDGDYNKWTCKELKHRI